MICFKFIVTGKVQGVWFRAAAQTEANKLGIKGYAKNLDDGSVEVIACGEQTALEQMEKWLWQGPEHAAVKDVVKSAIPECEFVSFTTH